MLRFSAFFYSRRSEWACIHLSASCTLPLVLYRPLILIMPGLGFFHNWSEFSEPDPGRSVGGSNAQFYNPVLRRFAKRKAFVRHHNRRNWK